MTRTRTNRPLLVFFTVAFGCVATACQRSEPTAATDAPAPAPAASTPPAVADTSAADIPPAGVLRAHVWDCDDGRQLQMRNLFRENAVALDFHEGTQRLEQTVSASGARYANADESIVFWTKGGAATLERRGTPATKCRERRAESLREDARLRGVVYRALGNEPGWTLEVGPGDRLDWTTNYGADHHAFEGAVESAGSDGATRTFTASHGADAIKVTVTAEPCTDDGDVAYDHTAVIESAGGTLRGCATKLN
jgi:membrane-bound inhibitor of C-type lysozyme